MEGTYSIKKHSDPNSNNQYPLDGLLCQNVVESVLPNVLCWVLFLCHVTLTRHAHVAELALRIMPVM